MVGWPSWSGSRARYPSTAASAQGPSGFHVALAVCVCDDAFEAEATLVAVDVLLAVEVYVCVEDCTVVIDVVGVLGLLPLDVAVAVNVVDNAVPGASAVADAVGVAVRVADVDARTA